MNTLVRLNAERVMLVWASIWMFLAIKGVISSWLFTIPLVLMALYFFPVRIVASTEKAKNLIFLHSVYLSLVCVLLIMRHLLESGMFISGMTALLSFASLCFLYWAHRIENNSVLITTIIAFIAIGSVHV